MHPFTNKHQRVLIMAILTKNAAVFNYPDWSAGYPVNLGWWLVQMQHVCYGNCYKRHTFRGTCNLLRKTGLKLLKRQGKLFFCSLQVGNNKFVLYHNEGKFIFFLIHLSKIIMTVKT